MAPKVTPTSTMPMWTHIVSRPKNQSTRSPNKQTKIEPAFAGMKTRVVVSLTHFNNKKFNG